MTPDQLEDCLGCYVDNLGSCQLIVYVDRSPDKITVVLMDDHDKIHLQDPSVLTVLDETLLEKRRHLRTQYLSWKTKPNNDDTKKNT